MDATATPEQLAAPLFSLQLWRVLCARTPNFPARFAVYRHFRSSGWVVRDGAAFGADFSLYATGPGQDHSVHTVLVMPLRVVEAATPSEAAPALPAAVSAATAAAAPAPPLAVRASPWSTCSTWVETHAHGRVIGSVRKHMVLAYVSLPVEPGAAELDAAAAGPSGVAAAAPPPALARPEAEEGADRITAGVEAAVADAAFYPPWLAARLSTPACVRAMLPVEIAGMARWIISVELANKTTAMMASLSQLAAEAALEQGVEIDMGALMRKPKEAKKAGGGKKGGDKKAEQLSAKEAAQRKKEAKAAAAEERRARAAALKAAALEARAAAAAAGGSAEAPLEDAGAGGDEGAAASGDAGEAADSTAGSKRRRAAADEGDRDAAEGEGGDAGASSAAAAADGGEGASGAVPAAAALSGATGKRKRSMIQHNPLARWEKKAAKLARREEARHAKVQHKTDVRRQLMAVLKGKQRAAASAVGITLLPPVVATVALVPQFDDALPGTNAAADVIAAALALPLPTMDGGTFRFIMGEGGAAPSAEVGPGLGTVHTSSLH